MTEGEYLKKTAFVSELGLGLHKCGATSHRIERHLKNTCNLLGINGTFLSSATSFTFCYWLDNPADQHIQIERIQPSDGELGRLELLDNLLDRYDQGELGFDEAHDELHSILAEPPHYGLWPSLLAFICLSASFSALLSFNANDAIASGLITTGIFFLARLGAKSERLSSTMEILAAMLTGITATGIAATGLKINVPFVILSSIVVFIPGLALTTALSEIANRDLISGTSKLVHAIMNLFKLYFGAILGVAIGTLLWNTGAGETLHGIHTLPEWKTLPAVILISFSLCLAFDIRPKQIPWCFLSAIIGFYIARTGESYFGVAAGMFLGAFCVGIYSNAFANIRRVPGSIPVATGIVLLVPGSKTYIILNSWITGEQMLENSPNGNQAFLIFISLVVGLLFASAVLPSRKSL